MTEEKRNYYLNLYKTELLKYCAPFWLEHSVDKENGGLINCVDRTGEIYSTDKSVWMQGRCGYTYSLIYNNVEKKPEYLTFAKSCIDFLNAHCFDSDSRMYFTVTKEGLPLRKRRYFFSETFYVSANAEYYLATKDEKCLEDAKRIYDMVFSIFKDPSTDPFKIFPKVYPSTRSMKAMSQPMILLNVSSIMREADPERTDLYNANIDYCIQEIKTHYDKEHHAMLENVNTDNTFSYDFADGRIVNPGHDLECSYFLATEAQYRNDKDLFEFSQTVFKDAIKRGWDEQYGGILYFKDVLGKPVEAYEHDMKLWWTHNEAINASMLMYKMTGDEYYFSWFEKLTKYAFDHFSDHEYGEWYGYLRRDGLPTEPPCKGHTYKGPFHVMRCMVTVINLLEK